MLVLLSRDLGGSVVRPRELPDLWTAHYKGNGFLDFVDCATSADSTAERKGRIIRESPDIGITE
jgi:hypothetical protein